MVLLVTASYLLDGQTGVHIISILLNAIAYNYAFH